MSPGETTLQMPVKKTPEDDSVWKKPSTTPRTWTKLRSPSTQRASRGQRALGGPPSACTWVWFHLETNMPKCRRANSRVLIMEPPEKCVSEGDGL